MPDQLRTARVTGATLGSELPARISELETAISVITGIPLDIIVNAPMAEVLTGGLRNVLFSESGEPTLNARLQRSGGFLKFHDGTAPRVNQVIIAPTQSGVISGVTGEFPFINMGVPANTLRSNNRFRAYFLVRVALLPSDFCQLRFHYGGIPGFSLTLANQSVSAAQPTLCPLMFELWANGAPSQQIISAKWDIAGTVQSNLPNAFATTTPILCNAAGLSVNSALDSVVQINVLFGTNNVGNQIETLGGIVWLEG